MRSRLSKHSHLLTALLMVLGYSRPLAAQAAPVMMFNPSIPNVGDSVEVRVEGLTEGRLGKVLFADRTEVQSPQFPFDTATMSTREAGRYGRRFRALNSRRLGTWTLAGE